MDSSTLGSALADEIFSKLKEELEGSICEQLTSTWVELWDEDERIKRRHMLAEECQKELREFLNEILTKERKARDDYIERIEQLLNEINDLQKSLEIAIPYEDVESLPLHDMAYHLNKKAEKYRVIRDQRVNQYNELARREAILCEKLGTIPIKAACSAVPTKTELKQYENHVNAMEQEKIDKTFTFLEQRQLICRLYQELGTRPVLTFEKEIVSDEIVENFKVTQENMRKVAELLQHLECQLEDAKQTVRELTDKLNLLWNYLEEPEEHRKQFLESHVGHSATIIAELKEELSRCEAMKRQNIAKIVGRMREVLVEEWDRCLVSQDERDKFRAFHIDCFTEDLCDLHEFEIKNLKDFYDNNKLIFNLLSEHKKWFNRLLELESKEKSVARFNNRGGKLLQEEKERRVISKELPIVEEKLIFLFKKFEIDNGRPFTIFGVPAEMKLDDLWASSHLDPKKIEKFRKREDAEKKGKTPLGKRGCAIPASAPHASKISRLNDKGGISSATKYLTPNPPQTPRRNVTARKKLLVEAQNTFVLEPTYDDFQSGLQAKVESTDKGRKVARSTAVNEVNTPNTRVLRERNTPQPLTRALTTPIKSTPGFSSAPMWSPSVAKTPKTLPRVTRRQSKMALFTPARNRLPIII